MLQLPRFNILKRLNLDGKQLLYAGFLGSSLSCISFSDLSGCGAGERNTSGSWLFLAYGILLLLCLLHFLNSLQRFVSPLTCYEIIVTFFVLFLTLNYCNLLQWLVEKCVQLPLDKKLLFFFLLFVT